MRTIKSPVGRSSRGRARLPRVVVYTLLLLALYFLFSRLLHAVQLHHTADGHRWHDTTTIHACSRHLPGGASDTPDGKARVELYDRLGSDVFSKGLPALTGNAASSQGMQLSDLFTFDGPKVTPVLTALDIPVRAIVIPIATDVAHSIHQETQRLLDQLVRPGDIWYQDPDLYHASVWHASHHKDPQAAGRAEVLRESGAVHAVARRSCPIRAVLERVVITAGGVLMACWQVERGGTEPSQLRRDLREALPRSPVKQLVSEPVILHTTIARTLRLPDELARGDGSAAVSALTHVADELSKRFCGETVPLSTLWYIEEHHTLALALGGNVTTYPHTLECNHDAIPFQSGPREESHQ